MGHETKIRWNPTTEWIYSDDTVYEPIVDDDTFAQVQTLAAAVVARVEAEWTAHLGQRHMAQLRQPLAMLREITDPYG
jgi:hypothetical protein